MSQGFVSLKFYQTARLWPFFLLKSLSADGVTIPQAHYAGGIHKGLLIVTVPGSGI